MLKEGGNLEGKAAGIGLLQGRNSVLLCMWFN